MPNPNGDTAVLHDPPGFVSRLAPRAAPRPARGRLPGLPRGLSGRRLTGRGLLPAALLGGLLLASSPAQAQVAEVSQEENFRNEPNGGLVAVLAPGTELTFHQRRENWVEATLEGWVWARSLLTTQRAGFDLVVATEEGENLRDRPSGEILGRLEDDTLLEEIERIPGWIRVRRRGWIWAASVDVDESVAAPSTAAAPVPVTEPPGRTDPEEGRSSAAPPAARADVVRGGRPVLSAPNGDTLSVLAPGAEVAVLGREGNWARVRVEGWVWAPEGEDPSEPASDAPELTIAAVAAAPEAARGRIVTWRLQYISSEVAEAVLTDFYEGEPYLLMRPADDEGGGFIYVALSPELVPQVAGLVPLERLTVVGRVRTGASRLTGSPVLDLIELRPG